ncbi:ribosyl nicotinamide transporter [Fructobacillus tropaeoli]|uniref:nicotinamide riboside transporter PnuC n=1 Tax=Fructobacillus tropaeoli TaxID=709323 RepID=UPI001455FD6B|nr:nicotinamide riboside transporter PnuC [Fructobacillus tropaeoli]NLS38424.1 ribosyl nicotinamide transporter [Fructobacillus tropaeoli]
MMENVKNKTSFWLIFKETMSPRRIAQDLVSLSRMTKALLLLMIIAQVATFLIGGSFNGMAWLTVSTGVSSLINLALVDQGKQSNYFWGLIGTATWMVVALFSRTYGDFTSQGFAFIMQFIGIAAWARYRGGAEKELPSRKLTLHTALITTLITILSYIAVVAFSKHFNGLQIYLDSAVLPLNIVGQILMTYGFRSQWIAWLASDVIQVIVWYRNIFLIHDAYASSMFVLQVIILINALYGTWYWYKKAKPGKPSL